LIWKKIIWDFLTFGPHRWADLSCYNILHGWESVQEFLRFWFFLKSWIFMVASIFIIFKMIFSLKTQKCLYYLEAVPFFWQLQLTKQSQSWFLLRIIKFFCISQLIVLPFAASSLITSPGLKNFTIFSKSFWYFSFIPSTLKNSR
jgi:hypothetical protein